MSSHPSLDIEGSLGGRLRGKRLVLCVAGSVAAYRAIDLARLLMRHGAAVTCVASPAALRLISAEYLRWATGREAVTALTGDLEHIRIADRGQADCVIAYPATANTLGKLANGIDDTPVSTVLTTALGAGIPVIVCPAMHQSMYENPAILRNMEYLKGMVDVVPPDVLEGKAKAPDPQRVLERVLRAVAEPGPLVGKTVLMTAGPTVEYIDPVRVITNVSTGATGMHLARCLMEAGARVAVIYGPGAASPPAGARVTRVMTSQEMAGALDQELAGSPDIVIMAAAVSDYAPKRTSGTKIRSGEMDSIPVRMVPKMINRVRDACGGAFLVGFKAETGVSAEDLVAAARRQLESAGADLVVANDVGQERYLRDPSCNEVVLVDGDSDAPSGWMPKEDIARHIAREIGRRIGG